MITCGYTASRARNGAEAITALIDTFPRRPALLDPVSSDERLRVWQTTLGIDEIDGNLILIEMRVWVAIPIASWTSLGRGKCMYCNAMGRSTKRFPGCRFPSCYSMS